MKIPINLMNGVIIAMSISLIFGPIMIKILRRIKFGQNIREEGPKSHQIKAGTPTMGGILIIIAITIATISQAWHDRDVLFLLVIFILFGLIGFTDDALKTIRKHSLGLRAWQKFSLQTIAALFFALYIFYFALDILLSCWYL